MRKPGNIPDSHSRQAVPRLALTHGQTLRLLSELGFREGVSESTFNSKMDWVALAARCEAVAPEVAPRAHPDFPQ
jgi:hypothetical protein